MPPQKGPIHPPEQGAERNAGAARKTATQRMDKPAHHTTSRSLPQDTAEDHSSYLKEERPLGCVQCCDSGLRFDEKVFALLDLLHSKRKQNKL